jgi:NADH-quinone oxidoreductase subunit C
MNESNTLQKIQTQFSQAVLATHNHRGDDTALVARESLVEVCRFLKEDTELLYNFLMDITAVDYRGKRPRFEVVYHFYSFAFNRRVRIKTPVPEDDAIVDSLTGLWPGANWFEREVWDMFGIRFRGHPDLRRILLYEPFEGHPLRKDYPIRRRQPLIGPRN